MVIDHVLMTVLADHIFTGVKPTNINLFLTFLDISFLLLNITYNILLLT